MIKQNKNTLYFTAMKHKVSSLRMLYSKEFRTFIIQTFGEKVKVSDDFQKSSVLVAHGFMLQEIFAKFFYDLSGGVFF